MPSSSRVSTNTIKKNSPVAKSKAVLSDKKKTINTTKGVVKVVTKQPKKTLSPYAQYVKRYTKITLLSPIFQKATKIIVIAACSVSVGYGAYHLVSTTFANEIIVSKSEIVARVAKLTPLPKDEPYEVVRVEDAELLRNQNEFYREIKEGDYIVMYKHIALIYDLRTNSIIAMRKAPSNPDENQKNEQANLFLIQ